MVKDAGGRIPLSFDYVMSVELNSKEENSSDGGVDGSESLPVPPHTPSVETNSTITIDGSTSRP